jgi:hypothetical protein
MNSPLNIPDDKRAGNHSSPLLKPLIIVGAVLVVFAAIFFPKLYYVDQKPALACGDEYFSKLRQRRVDEALEMYTEGFRQKQGEEWQRLLTQLDAQNGGVKDFKTLRSTLAPVQLRDATEIACVIVQYQVTRNALISEEKLTLCPHQRGAEWGIAGHEITRSDTGQHYEAGLTVQEKTIHYN